MSSPSIKSPEDEFLASLPLIERVIASVCRRNVCLAEDSEDFEQSVKLKLIEDDYGVLRCFHGRSSLSTYLTTVIHNHFRDYRIAKWGKWRPCAAARRMGTTAVRLDALLNRDGRALGEAIQILRSNFQVKEGSRELEEMAARLPARIKRVFEGGDEVERLAVTDGVENRVVDRERTATLAKVESALAEVIGQLPAQDRLLLKLRFLDGFSIAQIARSRGYRPRALYAWFEKTRRELLGEFDSRGVSSEEVTSILGWKGGDLQVDLGEDLGKTEEASV